MAWLVLGPVEREKKKKGGEEKGRKNGGWIGLGGGGEQGQGFVRRKVSLVKRPVDVTSLGLIWIILFCLIL